MQQDDPCPLQFPAAGSRGGPCSRNTATSASSRSWRKRSARRP